MCQDGTTPNGAACIPLLSKDGSQCGCTIVDEADANFVRQWTWRTSIKGYAQRSYRPTGSDKIMVKLHRELMGLMPGDGLEVDHINRNRLDNRRSNLRVLPRGANGQNVPGYRGSTSTFRGVSWKTKIGKWVAQISVNGKKHHIGVFESETDAANAARLARMSMLPFAVD